MSIQRIKIFSIVVVAGFYAIILSCNKPQVPQTNYTITGLKDVTLGENGSEVVTLQVEQLSENTEQVTLSLDGLPEGVSASLNTETQRPNFAVSLYLKDDSAAKGEHTINLNARSASGIERHYSFKVTTVDKICAIKAAGRYHATSICRNGTGLIFNNFYFWEDSSDLSRLYFNWNWHTAYAIVNCNKNQITIPQQTVGHYKIRGEGYMDQKYTVINITYIQTFNNGDTVSCNAHFFKR